MSTYKDIQGISIQSVTSDPPNPTEGQVWYNSTEGIFKVSDNFRNGVWSTGGTAPASMSDTGAAGTQTAALFFGGYDTDNKTLEYNGSTWSPGGNLTTNRHTLAGAGTQTAALAVGGYTPVNFVDKGNTEEYNGTTWAEQNDLSLARHGLCASGPQTAAIAFAGQPSSTPTQHTELYDGTSWTAAPGGTMNECNPARGGCGTQTAAIAVSGNTSPKENVEGYDGTSWTILPPTPSPGEGRFAVGIYDDCLAFGGQDGPVQKDTMEWNGVAWVDTTKMTNNRSTNFGGAGISTTAVAFGPGTSTEEWDAVGAVVTNILTSS
jgi:hypothetical protein